MHLKTTPSQAGAHHASVRLPCHGLGIVYLAQLRADGSHGISIEEASCSGYQTQLESSPTAGSCSRHIAPESWVVMAGPHALPHQGKASLRHERGVPVRCVRHVRKGCRGDDMGYVGNARGKPADQHLASSPSSACSTASSRRHAATIATSCGR